MADSLTDDVILNIIPKLDKSELSKLQNNINSQMQKLGDKSGKSFSKGFFKKFGAGFASMKSNWIALLGASAGIVAGFKSQDDKTVANLQQQIAYADTLGTTASQIGLSTKDFAKLYTLIRSGDVSSEVTIKAMQEFAKRLGEYKKTGAKAEIFGAITDSDNVGKAFLEAVALIGQEKDAGKKAYLIDQLMSGEAVEQMAEFFTQDISTLMKKASGKNYTALAKAIDTLGGEDTKLKEKRLELEQRGLVETSRRVGASGAELITKREEFNLNQILRETNAETMEGIRKTSEGFSVFGEAFRQGSSDLISGFAKTIKSITSFGDEVDNTTAKIQNSGGGLPPTLTYPAR